MFKKDDTVMVIESGLTTVVSSVNVAPTLGQSVVTTPTGNFYEEELKQAHPSVLKGATGMPKEEKDPVFSDELKTLMAKVLAGTAKDKEQTEEEKEQARKESIRWKLKDSTITLLKKSKLEIDLRGHWKSGSRLYNLEEFKADLTRDIYTIMFSSDEEILALKEALTTGTAMDTWVNLGGSGIECSHCEANYLTKQTNGKVIRFSGEDCPVPNGYDPNEWELNVPSGEMVVANDLRDWFPLPEGDAEIGSVNSVLGCRKTATAYADTGMSHAFVGNTCPSVFSMDNNKFKIANAPSEDIWDEEKEEWVLRDPVPEFDGTEVGNVCTDLWWYSLCDRVELQRRMDRGEAVNTLDELYSTFKVKPGVYRFRHYDDVDRDDHDNGVLFADFEWVRDPDPVKDFQKTYDAVEVNANAFVQTNVKNWPTLYGSVINPYTDKESSVTWNDMTEEQRHESWARVADRVFFTGGGGDEWHDKGFPKYKVDPSIPDIDPPSFRSQHRWYPFSKPYAGIFHNTLAPSFAKLAFRILESVISFGEVVHDSIHSRSVYYSRQRMLLSVERYRELALLYPEAADPEYVKWLNVEGLAEKWVERFDLGPTFTEKHRKHVSDQRWISDLAYAIEFDTKKLATESYSHRGFAGERGWASADTATAYAILAWKDNEQSTEHNCFWTNHAIDNAIPLYSVARVKSLGAVSHMGETLVELAFDYGSEWMRSDSRKAVAESKDKEAIRVLTKEEYELLLEKVTNEEA